MNKYLVLSASVLAVILIFAAFGGNPFDDYDYTGIVHDIRASSSGYVFYFDSSEGESFKCFFREEVSELGSYGVSGSFSDDGSIFFVGSAECLDARRL